MKNQTPEYFDLIQGLADRCRNERKRSAFDLTLSDQDVRDAMAVIGNDIAEQFKCSDVRMALGDVRFEPGSKMLTLQQYQCIGARFLGIIHAFITIFVERDVEERIAIDEEEARAEAGDARSDDRIAADEAGVPLAGPL